MYSSTCSIIKIVIFAASIHVPNVQYGEQLISWLLSVYSNECLESCAGW